MVYRTRPRGPVTRNACAAAADHTSSMTSSTCRSASSCRSKPAPSVADRGAMPAPPSRDSRPACSPMRSGCSPPVTQNRPSGKCARTTGSQATAAASTVLPIPPCPCRPTARTSPVTPTAPVPAPSSAARRPLSSSRSRYSVGSAGTPCSAPAEPGGSAATASGATSAQAGPAAAGGRAAAGAISTSLRHARTIRPSTSRGSAAASAPSRPGSCAHCTEASSGSWSHRQSPTSTGTSRTPCAANAGSSSSIMNREAR